MTAVVVADVGSMTNTFIASTMPTIMAIFALVGTAMHALLTRTHSPRLQQLENDVAAASTKIENVASTVQAQGQTISSAVSIVSSLSPGLSDLMTKNADRITAIENSSVSLDQKIKELQALLNASQQQQQQASTSGKPAA
jgi:septal ring factor EnvC (AmiA/AmiB activator)